MKKLSILIVMLLVLSFSTMALADGVIGQTLKIKDTDCTIAFTPGPFGCGDGCQTGVAMLKCSTTSMALQFVYDSSELTVYPEDLSWTVEFALIADTFRQLVSPGGIKLTK